MKNTILSLTFTRFIITGITATLIHIVSALGIYHTISKNITLASLGGFFIALIFGYFTHTYWSFQAKVSASNIYRFMSVNIILTLSNLALIKVSGLWSLPANLTLICIAASLAIISFIIHKKWTYKI